MPSILARPVIFFVFLLGILLSVILYLLFNSITLSF